MTSQPPPRSRFAPLVQGGAAFGGLFHPVDPDQVQQALETAWELGLRAFDTAPHYGVGRSEELVGRFLRTKPRDEFVLSTKVGRLLVDDPDAPTEGEGYVATPHRRRVPDYTADGVRRSLDASLERLGLDRVDVALVHDPEDHLDTAVREAAPALAELRSQGVLGGFGVGTNFSATAERFVAETDLDHLLLAGRYTLLERGPAETLLPACAEHGVAVLAAGVFNSGLLVDPTAAGARYNYVEAPADIVARAQRMEAACTRAGVSLRAAAVQFPARHPAVTAVVLGAGSAAEVRDSWEQLQVPVPESLWGELADLAG